MKCIIYIWMLLSTALALSINEEWENFKQKYNKKYHDVNEETYRLAIYLKNKDFIEAHNEKFKSDQSRFRLGINKFADMSPLEYQSFISNTQKSQRPKKYLRRSYQQDAPDSIDWRYKGYVTSVKDQGPDCKSSWAFSAAGAIEGLLSKGYLTDLSPQNIMDCSLMYGTNKCKGGMTYQAFEYVIGNGGIDTEQYYPYEGDDGLCHFDNGTNNVGGYCRDYIDVLQGDENDLKNACGIHGPISASIDGSQQTFQFYEAGIYYDANCNPENLNQGVLIVGYSAFDGNDYWIVKNSWGTDWGESGYIMVARNSNNTCGIANEANYPII